MLTKPAVVIFFNDWAVYPSGVNAGGGESATMALARAIKGLGYRVIACAHLPTGDCEHEGIEFWNFGPEYALHEIAKRLEELPAYHCIAATLVHPFLHIRAQPNCLSRILINHSPALVSSGLETTTVLHAIDYMLCVSDIQRSIILSRKVDGERIKVVRNGFDPEVFTYAGPEGRDWDQLIFIGRVDAPKGIHVLLQVFGELKGEFPNLKLAVFGDESYWPEFTSHKYELMRKLPGLQFHGKVPQREIARQLQTAGMLVFPSQTFETAGLAVIDAQASGCPVVANGVGGVPEYLVEKELGDLVYDKSPTALRDAIAALLRDKPRLRKMSESARLLGRTRPWSVVAEEVMHWAEQAASTRIGISVDQLPAGVQQIKNVHTASAHEVLLAHELMTKSDEFSDDHLEKALMFYNRDAWPHLINGFRCEESGSVDQAIESYRQAAEKSIRGDWQAFFRLALVHAERKELPLARGYAERVIEEAPGFELRAQLEQLISHTKV
jgi:glycosyltransferase involved in cell wall biosynthesis